METTTMTRAVETIKVGDVVEHTGGYNCTQTQFYTVVSVSKSGKKMGVRRLQTIQVSGDWMNGAIEPVIGNGHGDVHELMVKTDYKGEMMLRGRINSTVRDQVTNEVKWINRGSVENFYKWSGKPMWVNCD